MEEIHEFQMLGVWGDKFIHFGYVKEISYSTCLVFKNTSECDMIDISWKDMYGLIGALCLKLEQFNRVSLKESKFLSSMYRRLHKYANFGRVKFFKEIYKRSLTELGKSVETCRREITWFMDTYPCQVSCLWRKVKQKYEADGMCKR